MTAPLEPRRHRVRAVSRILIIDGRISCTDCGEAKPATIEFFHANKNTYTGFSPNCKPCVRNRRLKHYWSKPKEIAAKVRESWKVLRLDVLNHYSPSGIRCACCGETELDFMAVDHVIGRKEQGTDFSGGKLYRWLKRNNYPEGYQVLCCNCNWSKGLHGICVHQTKKES